MIFSLAEQIRYELTSVLRGYPSFVLRRSGKLKQNELPVFVYHTIKPEEFESDLRYLQGNGYVTIDLRQYLDALKHKVSLPEKSVLLTIDDGRSSFWRYGYPLLKRFRMKATLFVIPGYIQATHENNDNLLTLGDSVTSRAHLKTIDPQDHELCSWEQLREMHLSGYIAIESHTLFHREVFTEPKIINWIDTRTSFVPHYSPVSAYLDFADVGNTLNPQHYLGLPLFQSTPLMVGKPALKIPAELKELCRKRYGQDTQKTHQELLDSGLLAQITRQSAAEVEAVIEQDLALSQRLIQQNVSPQAGRHLCLPFTQGSPQVIAAAKKVGLQSCSWGTIPGKRINHAQTGNTDTAMHIVRIKSDFIPRLPGKHRSSLLAIYLNKLGRRIQGEAAF